MRKLLIAAVALAMIQTSCNNTENKTHTPVKTYSTTSLEHHLAVYEEARKNKDDVSAIVALNYVLVEDSTRTDLIDSLAREYSRALLFEPAVSWAEKALKLDGENDKMRELIAICKRELGEYEDAIKQLQYLYDKLGNDVYKFEIAGLKLRAGSNAEAVRIVNELIKDGKDTSMVSITVQGDGTTSVPLRAGCYFVLAQVDIANQDLVAAQRHLKQALKEKPDFKAATQTLQDIKNYLAEAQQYQQQMQMQQQQMEEQRKLQQLYEEGLNPPKLNPPK